MTQAAIDLLHLLHGRADQLSADITKAIEDHKCLSKGSMGDVLAEAIDLIDDGSEALEDAIDELSEAMEAGEGDDEEDYE